jgi:RimJ/RimL family protein N-acetyltransferase
MAEIKNDLKIILMQQEDLPVLVNWAEDEKTLIQWCGPVFNFPLTIDQLDPYYSETLKECPSRYIFKAVKDDNIIAGMSELGAVDRRNGTASLCRIFVDKNYRGNGFAELMITKILNFAFNELNLRRVELNVYSYNTPAFKCYEKLGFVREGLKRQVTEYKGEFWDGYFYSILKEEWLNQTEKSENRK